MKVAVVNLITRTPTKRKIPRIFSNKDAMIVKFCLEMRELSCDLDLYISDFYEAEKDENLGLNVNFVRSYFKSLPEIPFVPGLVRSLIRGNYSIILLSEAFQWSTVFAVIAWFFSVSKPKVVIWQELAVHQRPFFKIPSKIFYRIVLRFFLDRGIFAYIPRSSAARKFLIDEHISNGKILTTISHGADDSVFFPSRDELTSSYLFCPSRLVIYEKGLDVLLAAFKIVVSEVPSAKLVIQGAGPDEGELFKLISQLGLSDSVDVFTEFVNHNQMRVLYQGALATVITSRRDNVILSSMESALCGTPVIISDAIDNSDVFSDARGGGVFSSGDFEGLASKILTFYKEPGLIEEARIQVLDKAKLLSNKAMARKMVDVLTSIANA